MLITPASNCEQTPHQHGGWSVTHDSTSVFTMTGGRGQMPMALEEVRSPLGWPARLHGRPHLELVLSGIVQKLGASPPACIAAVRSS